MEQLQSCRLVSTRGHFYGTICSEFALNQQCCGDRCGLTEAKVEHPLHSTSQVPSWRPHLTPVQRPRAAGSCSCVAAARVGTWIGGCCRNYLCLPLLTSLAASRISSPKDVERICKAWPARQLNHLSQASRAEQICKSARISHCAADAE